MKLNREKILQLLPFFKQNFIKGYANDQDAQQILSHAELIQMRQNQSVFNQGDQINSYFYLIKGLAAVCKNSMNKTDRKLTSQLQQVDIIQPGKVIGQYFNSIHIVRQFSAIIKGQNSQIIKIDKKIFNTVCSSMLAKYNQVDRFAKNIMKADPKTNSFQVFNIQNYRLGCLIKLSGQIGIIVNGQCKVVFSSNNQNETSMSPSKFSLPFINVKKAKQKIKQVALIGQNEWIYTQNLQDNFMKSFKYSVYSQSLNLLTFNISKVGILSDSKVSAIKKIHKERLERVKGAQRLSCKIDKQREASNSPVLKNRKLGQAHKILQNVDPNISPLAILKKYKLGYNQIRYENYERNQRTSVGSQMQILRREKTERKLKKYYKAKDWSKYVKIPNIEF